MSIQDIQDITSNNDARTVELLRTQEDITQTMPSACAMLNSNGGWVFIGVDPDTKEIVGQTVTDDQKSELGKSSEGMEPAVNLNIEYVDLPESDGKQVAVITLKDYVPGTEPYTYNGCPYIKDGTETIQMPRHIFQQRLRECNPQKFAWDARPAYEAKVTDLDTMRIRNVVQRGVVSGRIEASYDTDTIESLLDKLKLRKDGQLTNAAMALFGKNIDDYPQFLLRMACFKGIDKNEFIDNKRVQGNLFDLLEAGTQFCFRNLNLSGRIVGLTREEHLEIPIEALREGLINALCHRTLDNPSASVSLAIYDDRVEIVNPGSFPADITATNIMLPHESFPRNLLMAQALYQTTYLESWGSGVKRMVELCTQQNALTPYYEEGTNTITLIFPRLSDKQDVGKNVGKDVGKDNGVQITDRQSLILKLIRQDSSISAREMSEKMSVNERTIERDLAKLSDMGYIYHSGGKKNGHWVLMS